MSLPKVLSSIIHQIASGTPIWKITVPASIHTDKSGVSLQKEYMFSNAFCLESFNKVDSLDDPIDRLGCIIQATIDPYMKFSTDKPFNPIQGEFISVSTELRSGRYQVDIEQIWHHPPVLAFRLQGPTFELTIPGGMDSSGGFKPSLNSIEVSFPGAIAHLKTKTKGVMEWSQPHFRIENLVFGKKTGGIGGEWWIKDSSGHRFECTISMGSKMKGEIIAPDGTVIDSVEGDMFKGLYLKKSKKLWVKGEQSTEKIKEVYDDSVLNDPEFSENVWAKVYQHMRSTPPDYDAADKEKGIVEQKQRDDMKKRNNEYKSRFGFECKYMHEKK